MSQERRLEQRGKAEMRKGLWCRGEKNKEMTTSPVRGKITECLEMLRWTEAISSTNTAPASLPASSHSLTDFLLWVFVRLWVSFCPWKCVSLNTRYYSYSCRAIFVSTHKQTEILCSNMTNPRIPALHHFNTCVPLIAFHVKYGKGSLSIGFTFNDCTNSKSV